MKEKMYYLFQFAKPHLALFMAVILIACMLPVADVTEVEAAIGSREAWLKVVSGKSFTYKEVPDTITEYTEYVVSGNSYVAQTVEIDRNAALGSRTNPYAIETPEELVLFGQLKNTSRYFILTASEYDMQGDSYYMEPLFPNVLQPVTVAMARSSSGSYSQNYFAGTLIGNQAVIKNAYISNIGNNTQLYQMGLFNRLSGACIWDLKLENCTYTGTGFNYMGAIASQVSSESKLINCEAEYTLAFDDTSNMSNAGTLVGMGSDKVVLQNCLAKVSASVGTVEVAGNALLTFPADENTEFGIEGNGDMLLGSAVLQVQDGTQIHIYKDGSYGIGSEEGAATANQCVLETGKNYYNYIFDYRYEGVEPVWNTIEKGSAIDAPKAERAGYVLMGWSSEEGSLLPFPYVVDSNITMYAVWESVDQFEDVADLTATNVTIADKEKLVLAQEKLNTLLTGQMSEEDREKLNERLTCITQALATIAKVEAVQSKINALSATISLSDASSVAEAQEAYDALSAYEKSLVGSSMKTKLDTAKAKITELEEKEKLPAKGTKHKDDGKKAWYEITKAGATGGTVSYVKPVDKKTTSVTIPATVKINGVKYKVTAISKNAFKGNTSVKTLTIGSNVKTIGKQAFYKCTKLKTVKIGKNVTTIGEKAFYGCKKLGTITIQTKKLTKSKVGKQAFKGIKSTAKISVPKSKYKSYKSILKKKGVSAKAKFKKIK